MEQLELSELINDYLAKPKDKGSQQKLSLMNIITLNGPIPDKVKKLSQISIFTLLCGASKGFMKSS